MELFHLAFFFSSADILEKTPTKPQTLLLSSDFQVDII